MRYADASLCLLSVFRSVRVMTISNRARPRLVLPQPFFPTISTLLIRPSRIRTVLKPYFLVLVKSMTVRPLSPLKFSTANFFSIVNHL